SGDASCGNCGGESCGFGRGHVIGLLNELQEREKAISALTAAIEAKTVADYGKACKAAHLAKMGEVEVATRYLLEIIRSVEPEDYTYGEAIEALGKWGTRSTEVFDVLFAVARESQKKSPHNLHW